MLDSVLCSHIVIHLYEFKPAQYFAIGFVNRCVRLFTGVQREFVTPVLCWNMLPHSFPSWDQPPWYL